MYAKRREQSAYTLIEVVLVVALLVAISALAIPNFVRELKREELPGSARQLRSLITLTRANAAFDGLRYRIRFPSDDEDDLLLARRQPMIEREDDPIHEPDVFNQVTAPWAIGTTLLGVWPITLDPVFSGLAWSLIFGLIASTLFTLIVVPTVYMLSM